eukprot:symbB.v1.2.033527.t1/scaffold4171.1/size43550/2
MKRNLNRASTLPANKIVTAVTKRPPQRSTTQANMDPVAENGAAAAASAASATASVVVVARIRPKLPKEDKEPDGVEVYSDAQTLSIYNNGREKKQYTLDQVFDSRWRMQTARSARSNESVEKSPRPSAAEQEAAESQVKFFNDFGRNLVTHSLKGYNVCVFAYGHTGSGKTYTMLGDAAGSGRGAAAGLLPRFLIELFQEHEDAPRPDTWRCSCEFFEVYNEQIRDLLQPNATVQKPKRVHCHPKHGARIEGLTMSVVNSAEEVMELLQFGNQMRTVAATTMNSRSSRSHAFFNFKYEQIGEEPDQAPGPPPPPPQARGKERRVTIAAPPDTSGGGSCMSAVTFVDLAGREERERLGNHPGALQYKEMCFINTSLFHLAHLITKISQGGLSSNNLSDFRNSKVTMLLSQALQGNSRTAVVATLSPIQSAFEDSMSTLNFAASAKKIQTKPVVNSKSAVEKLAELENEVHSLQVELAQSKTSNTEKEQELLSAQAWINYYKRSWEEATCVLGYPKSEDAQCKAPRTDSKWKDQNQIEFLWSFCLAKHQPLLSTAEKMFKGLLLWAALVNVFTFQASAAYANAPTFVGLDDAPGDDDVQDLWMSQPGKKRKKTQEKGSVVEVLKQMWGTAKWPPSGKGPNPANDNLSPMTGMRFGFGLVAFVTCFWLGLMILEISTAFSGIGCSNLLASFSSTCSFHAPDPHCNSYHHLAGMQSWLIRQVGRDESEVLLETTGLSPKHVVDGIVAYFLTLAMVYVVMVSMLFFVWHVSAEKQSGFRHLLHVSGLSRSALSFTMLAKSFLYGCICVGILATALAIFVDKSSIIMLKGLVSTTSSDTLSRLQRTYLAAYLCAMMADWLQGPFVYALYDKYGFSREDNASLFVAGFGSSALFGTFVGSLADKYGRRNFAGLYCVLYLMSCLTKHFNSFWMLMVGRITGGIATSLLFSVFDSWLVSEHTARGFHGDQLSASFSIAFFGNSLVAIMAGALGQYAADLVELTQLSGSIHYGGYTSPFVTANFFLILCMSLLTSTWSENFGQSSKAREPVRPVGGRVLCPGCQDPDNKNDGLMGAAQLVLAQPLIGLCGIVCCLFESSMFIFVFNWTPVLKEEMPHLAVGQRHPEIAFTRGFWVGRVLFCQEGEPDPPFGHIFMGFMIMCMLGSRCFSLAGHHFSNERIGLYTLIVAAACHASILLTDSVSLRLLAFFIFEMAVGLYFPMMGTMKGQIVPESKRATIYNLYRLPLNVIVVLTLTMKLGASTSFFITSVMLAAAACAQARIIKMGGARPATLPAPIDEEKAELTKIGKPAEEEEENP